MKGQSICDKTFTLRLPYFSSVQILSCDWVVD